ncbi:MAG: barstar family protein [Oscillospiraceae bacterium]|nr:barstar family protein [Oscillospiraceae bacterium]
MRRITLDLSDISLRYELHLSLKKAFGFPDYYGMNLDALHDCLTDITEDTEIEILNAGELIESLGSYGAAAVHVIENSAEENEHVKLL